MPPRGFRGGGFPALRPLPIRRIQGKIAPVEGALSAAVEDLFGVARLFGPAEVALCARHLPALPSHLRVGRAAAPRLVRAVHEFPAVRRVLK
jgi:hypothetical protein